MDVDPLEYVESDDEKDEENRTKEARKSRLNAWVAITVALLATFMAVCNVKDNNIVQGMQQAQAKSIDNWSFYQARNIRQEIAHATAAQLALQEPKDPTAHAAWEKTLAEYKALDKEQGEKKQKVRADAEAQDKLYDALNIHDDQFDLSEALLSLAIALLAMTSLTQKKWLYFLALIPIIFGVIMGLSGLLGWGLHPDAIIKPLT